MKAGFIPKAAEKRLSKVSAYAEAAGYAANIAVNLHKIRMLQLQELLLRLRLHKALKARTLAPGARLRSARTPSGPGAAPRPFWRGAPAGPCQPAARPAARKPRRRERPGGGPLKPLKPRPLP
jgi:hypothetical protein